MLERDEHAPCEKDPSHIVDERPNRVCAALHDAHVIPAPLPLTCFVPYRDERSELAHEPRKTRVLGAAEGRIPIKNRARIAFNARKPPWRGGGVEKKKPLFFPGLPRPAQTPSPPYFKVRASDRRTILE